MPAAGRLALAAAERVIHRIHRDAAHVRPLAQPPAAPGLADRHVLVIEIANLADGGDALDVDLPDLARRHLDGGVLPFPCHELYGRSGAARDLAALAGPQLDVVNLRAQRDVLQRQAVARKDVDGITGYHRVTHLDARRLQDVSLFAVRIGDQRDARRPVRVVLDRLDTAGNVLLIPLEVDDPVEPLVAAAAPPRRQLAAVVAAAGPFQLFGERAIRLVRRDVVERLHGPEARTGRRRVEFSNRHLYAPCRNSGSFSPSRSFTYAFFQSARRPT